MIKWCIRSYKWWYVAQLDIYESGLWRIVRFEFGVGRQKSAVTQLLVLKFWGKPWDKGRNVRPKTNLLLSVSAFSEHFWRRNLSKSCRSLHFFQSNESEHVILASCPSSSFGIAFVRFQEHYTGFACFGYPGRRIEKNSSKWPFGRPPTLGGRPNGHFVP